MNSAIVIAAAARDLVSKHDSRLLDTNGVRISLNKNWANKRRNRMGMVK